MEIIEWQLLVKTDEIFTIGGTITRDVMDMALKDKNEDAIRAISKELWSAFKRAYNKKDWTGK